MRMSDMPKSKKPQKRLKTHHQITAVITNKASKMK